MHLGARRGHPCEPCWINYELKDFFSVKEQMQASRARQQAKKKRTRRVRRENALLSRAEDAMTARTVQRERATCSTGFPCHSEAGFTCEATREMCPPRYRVPPEIKALDVACNEEMLLRQHGAICFHVCVWNLVLRSDDLWAAIAGCRNRDLSRHARSLMRAAKKSSRYALGGRAKRARSVRPQIHSSAATVHAKQRSERPMAVVGMSCAMLPVVELMNTFLRQLLLDKGFRSVYEPNGHAYLALCSVLTAAGLRWALLDAPRALPATVSVGNPTTHWLLLTYRLRSIKTSSVLRFLLEVVRFDVVGAIIRCSKGQNGKTSEVRHAVSVTRCRDMLSLCDSNRTECHVGATRDDFYRFYKTVRVLPLGDARVPPGKKSTPPPAISGGDRSASSGRRRRAVPPLRATCCS